MYTATTKCYTYFTDVYLSSLNLHGFFVNKFIELAQILLCLMIIFSSKVPQFTTLSNFMYFVNIIGFNNKKTTTYISSDYSKNFFHFFLFNYYIEVYEVHHTEL